MLFAKAPNIYNMNRLYFILSLVIFGTLSLCAQNSSETRSMRVWKNGTFTSYNINEVDSVTFSTETAEDEDSVIVSPDIYDNSEEQLKGFVAGMYKMFGEFYQQEQILESYALGLQNGNVITPENSQISSCWTKGYNLVANCNYATQNFSSKSYPFNPEKYFAQIECIREITLYMMSQLWGDIPAPDKVITDFENVYETSKINILGRAYGALNAYRERMTDDSDYYLNSKNILPIMREIEIELEEYGYQYKYNYPNLDTRFKIRVEGTGNDMTVVDKNSWTMLLKEKDTATEYNAFADELLNSFGKRYGVWRAMVRIGKATPRNGMSPCLLFPKPINELLLNPHEHQNEGYSDNTESSESIDYGPMTTTDRIRYDFVDLYQADSEYVTLNNMDTRLRLEGGLDQKEYYRGNCLWLEGKYDATFLLPAVPKTETYEIRIGYSAADGNGICQTYFGSDPNSLSATGIPFDFRISGNSQQTGWEADTQDSEFNDEVDRRMRNNGFMKAPAVPLEKGSQTRGGATIYVLRPNPKCLRHIVLRQRLNAGSKYYLRLKSVIDGNRPIPLDYVEFCPQSTYGNQEMPEDRY